MDILLSPEQEHNHGVWYYVSTGIPTAPTWIKVTQFWDTQYSEIHRGSVMWAPQGSGTASDLSTLWYRK